MPDGVGDVQDMVLIESELRAIRSVEHFALVIEQKRLKQFGKLHAVTLTEDEIARLDAGLVAKRDASSQVRTFRRGMETIEAAIREARERVLEAIVEVGRDMPSLPPDKEWMRAERALSELDALVEDRRENPDEDPLWIRVRQGVALVGAAFARIFRSALDDDEDAWRSLSFEIRSSGPQRVGAHVDSELWPLLTRHYMKQIRVGGRLRVRRSAIAVVALAMEEIVAIDDIDPRDAFDDYAEYDSY